VVKRRRQSCSRGAASLPSAGISFVLQGFFRTATLFKGRRMAYAEAVSWSEWLTWGTLDLVRPTLSGTLEAIEPKKPNGWS
jgi:hypothetical protein